MKAAVTVFTKSPGKNGSKPEISNASKGTKNESTVKPKANVTQLPRKPANQAFLKEELQPKSEKCPTTIEENNMPTK